MQYPDLNSVQLEAMARHYAEKYGIAKSARFFRLLADRIEDKERAGERCSTRP